MPLHEMRSTCGFSDEVYFPITVSPTPLPCPHCSGLLRRRFHPPAVSVPFVPHFNHSVGRYVRSRADFRAALAQGAEEASALTGRNVVYAETHPSEHPPPSEEGLAEQARAWAAKGVHFPASP